jgi:SAM-dependent methyltransferase
LRLAGKLAMGYFPLVVAEASRIRRFLDWPATESSVLDPCAGCGRAVLEITRASKAVRYGVELDAYRAEQAATVMEHVIQGSAFDVHCPVESFSCLYLNPPYDWECSDRQNARMEGVFLEHCYRYLKPGGVLVLVVPGPRLDVCDDVLAVHFRDKAIYRLSEPEAVRYQQVVVFGVRRTHHERARLKDWDVGQAKRKLQAMARQMDSLPVLPDQADRVYRVPPGGPVQWVNRGIPLDAVEDLLPRSAAYRQAFRSLFAPPALVCGRPLIPLHSGAVGLISVSGMLDGCFGSGEARHVACWQSTKVVDRFEEVEDGVTTIRERERFTQTLAVAFVDGTTAILTDGSKSREECAPAFRHAAVSEEQPG